MDIHKLLKRQLEKCNIQVIRLPESHELWLNFIAKVNQTYIDADQERYLINRTMEISSREMMELNKKLENAQHLAKLGYWSYDGNSDHSIWSDELFRLLNLNPNNAPPNFKQFIELVHEQDRYELLQKVENALKNKIDYECEIRLKDAEGKYCWYKAIGHCLEEKKQLTGVLIDINNSKIAEEKIRGLTQKIVSSARRAGMAEVAASILHNIGNILNSSNISINLIQNSLNQNYMNKLLQTLELLDQNKKDLTDFLINDPKGQIIPQYILGLSKVILEDHQKNTAEVDNLINDLKHISEIVAMQRSVSGISSMKETIYIPEIIEIALNMSISPIEGEFIGVIKEFDICPSIENDKSKLLQILINVIQNAKDSVLLNTTNPIKEIKLSIQKNSLSSIQIIIEDNGIGVNPNDLNRIFSFGFTTKENGHGFGLHSSALSAEAMGGSLYVESLGEGCGAKFMLTLPI